MAVTDDARLWATSNKAKEDDHGVMGCAYRGDSNLAKVQLNINSKALVAHIDRVV